MHRMLIFFDTPSRQDGAQGDDFWVLCGLYAPGKFLHGRTTTTIERQRTHLHRLLMVRNHSLHEFDVVGVDCRRLGIATARAQHGT